jgi:hypothetical protein
MGPAWRHTTGAFLPSSLAGQVSALFLIDMAENIYSKGTRVWFEDKDHAWISAEVASATKGDDDSIKLVFVDERGKVRV